MTGKKTWKQQKLDFMKHLYGKYIDEFRGCQDDRGLYCNTYWLIVEAIESLDDNPNNYVCVAVNNAIRADLAMMDGILVRFGKVKEVV